MDTLLQDLRYGIRVLAKRPGFTLVAVLTLALGIGANTAIFSVVHALLIRPLPFAEGERLVAIEDYRPDGRRGQVTPANFLDWRAACQSYEQMAAIFERQANLTGAGDPERLEVAVVSANLFDLLGAGPAAGRLFLPSDEAAGHAPVAVLSHGLWQRRFGGDPAIVGQTITLDGKGYTVVGVAQAGFVYPRKVELWLPPLRLAPELNERVDVAQLRSFGYLSAIARLKPGVSVEQAHAEMLAVSARLREQYPDANGSRLSRVVSLRSHLVGETRPALLVLMAAVGCLLLIACANIANLLLARATARQKEMAVRAALGAGRGRIIRQLLTESLVIAMAGGAAGLLVGSWGVDLLLALAPDELLHGSEVRLDGSVLGFTAGLALLTGLVFGLGPALQVSSPDVQMGLKEGASQNIGGAGRNRLRGLLVVSEVALSLVLLVSAGLLIRSFWKLQQVDPGFTTERILTMKLAPAGPGYDEAERLEQFFATAIERVGALPGVEAAAAVSRLPLNKGQTMGYQIEGRPPVTDGHYPDANMRMVSEEYFRVLQMPIVEGRGFDERDRAEVPSVVVVNQALARRDFPGESVVGKQISFVAPPGSEPRWMQIIGVVADSHTVELGEPPRPDVFFSYREFTPTDMSIVMRAAGDPLDLAAAARRAVSGVDPNQPITEVQTLAQVAARAVEQPRFNMLLLGIFAGVALLLAVAGIYGVLAYTVSQRTHEIGVRMALGASAGDVLAMVLKQGLGLTLTGVAAGLGAALLLTRWLESLLFGVSPNDPLTFAAITMVLVLVALLACLVPARRATRVDPMEALRYE